MWAVPESQKPDKTTSHQHQVPLFGHLANYSGNLAVFGPDRRRFPRHCPGLWELRGPHNPLMPSGAFEGEKSTRPTRDTFVQISFQACHRIHRGQISCQRRLDGSFLCLLLFRFSWGVLLGSAGIRWDPMGSQGLPLPHHGPAAKVHPGLGRGGGAHRAGSLIGAPLSGCPFAWSPFGCPGNPRKKGGIVWRSARIGPKNEMFELAVG